MTITINLDAQLMHELYLDRLNSGYINASVYPGLEETYRLIRLLILDGGLPRTPKQLETIEKRIQRIIESNSGWEDYTKDMQEAALYEVRYMLRNTELTPPAKNEILSFIGEQMIVMEQSKQAGFWDEFITGNNAGRNQRIMAMVRQGYSRAETVNQVLKNIRAEFDGTLKTRAESLARTAFTHYVQQARRANVSAHPKYYQDAIFVAVWDNRTSLICRTNSKKRFKADDPKLPIPPLHYNAIAKGELVKTHRGDVPIEMVKVGDKVVTHKGRLRRVSAVMKKPNDTRFIRVINMNTGAVIRATDEHPVLIDGSGWVRADKVKVGDKMFQHFTQEAPVVNGSPVVEVSPNDYPSLFDGEEVFFEVSTSPSVMASSINLDGDLILNEREVSNRVTDNKLMGRFDGEVGSIGVVDKGSFSDDVVCPVFFSHAIKNLLFNIWPIHWVVALHSFRVALEKLAVFLGFPVTPMVFANTQAFSNFNGGRFLASLTPAHSAKAMNTAPSANCSIGEGKLPLNGSHGLSESDIMLSHEGVKEFSISKFDLNHFCAPIVTSISIVEYNDDVYNLEVEDDNTYLVNDIVVHNCRSTLIYGPEGFELTGQQVAIGGKSGPAAKEAFEKKEARTDGKPKYRGKRDKDAFDPTTVRSDTSHEAWLRRQPRWFVESSLGNTRAKLFLDGKLSLSKFTDMTGRTITLNELEQEESTVFKRLGL